MQLTAHRKLPIRWPTMRWKLVRRVIRDGLLLTSLFVGIARADQPADTFRHCFGYVDCARCLRVDPVTATVTWSAAQESCPIAPGGGPIRRSDAETGRYLSQIRALSAPEDVPGSGPVLFGYQAPWPRRGAATTQNTMLTDGYEANRQAQKKDAKEWVDSSRGFLTGRAKQIEDVVEKTAENRQALREKLQFEAAFIHSDMATIRASRGAALTGLASTPLEPLPAAPAGATRFDGTVQPDDTLTEEIVQSIPEEHLRPEGPSLRPGLEKERREKLGNSPSERRLAQERKKVEAAHGRGEIDINRAKDLIGALLAAADLNGTGTLAGEKLSERILNDVQSWRYAETGKSPYRDVTIIAGDGTLITEVQDADAKIPDDALVSEASRFVATQAVLDAQIAATDDVVEQRSEPDRSLGENALAAARGLRDAALGAFADGEVDSSELLQTLGLGAVNQITLWVPGLSVGRSAIELITGEDMFSGEKLSAFDQFAAATDIVTFGAGGKGLKVLKRIAGTARGREMAERVLKLANRAAEKAQSLGMPAGWITQNRAKHIATNHVLGGANAKDGKTAFYDAETAVDGLLGAIEHGDEVVSESAEYVTKVWRRPGELPLGVKTEVDGNPAIPLTDVQVTIHKTSNTTTNGYPVE